MKLETREGIKLAGKITIKTYAAGTCEHAELFFKRAALAHQDGLLDERDEHALIGKQILADGYIATPVVQKNLIMQSTNYGLDLVVQRLVGMNTYSLNILYIEIGTGSTTPALTDTVLTTPTNRAAVGNLQDYGTTDAIVTGFFSDSQLANATYYECGGFVDGTATIGTGQIFNHALFSSPYTKIAGQDTQVQIDFSVANS